MPIFSGEFRVVLGGLLRNIIHIAIIAVVATMGALVYI